MPIPSQEKFREDVVENSSGDIYKRFNNVFNRFNNIGKAVSKSASEFHLTKTTKPLANDDLTETKEITYEKDGIKYQIEAGETYGNEYQIEAGKPVGKKIIRVSRQENGEVQVRELAEINGVLRHDWHLIGAEENASKEEYFDNVEDVSDEYFLKNIIPFFEEAINDAENYKRKTDQEKIKEKIKEAEYKEKYDADALIKNL